MTCPCAMKIPGRDSGSQLAEFLDYPSYVAKSPDLLSAGGPAIACQLGLIFAFKDRHKTGQQRLQIDSGREYRIPYADLRIYTNRGEDAVLSLKRGASGSEKHGPNRSNDDLEFSEGVIH
jgi:hypothetical protein